MKNNDMTVLKVAKGLPCADEKSPPEDSFADEGCPSSFEEDKAICVRNTLDT